MFHFFSFLCIFRLFVAHFLHEKPKKQSACNLSIRHVLKNHVYLHSFVGPCVITRFMDSSKIVIDSTGEWYREILLLFSSNRKKDSFIKGKTIFLLFSLYKETNFSFLWKETYFLFSLAQRKDTKETSTYPHPLTSSTSVATRESPNKFGSPLAAPSVPYMEGLNRSSSSLVH